MPPSPFSSLLRHLHHQHQHHHRLLLRRIPLHPFSSLNPNPTTPQNPNPNPTRPSPEATLYALRSLSKEPQKALAFFDGAAAADENFATWPTAYNLMLRILGQKRSAAEFWRFLRDTERFGLSMDQGTYLAVLANFKKEKMVPECSALSDYYSKNKINSSADAAVSATAEAVRRIENWDNAEGFELPDTEIALAKVLRELRDCPIKALDFFRWAGRRPRYRHGPVSYNAMARVLGREETVKEFWELVQEMKAEGVDLDIDTYVKLSRQFQKRHMLAEAVKLYELMMDGPYKPSLQDGPVLLRRIAMSPSPELELVYRVVRKFEDVWHYKTKDMFDGIHRVLTSNGQFEEAAAIMRDMPGHGHMPDNITYSQLVFGLCKARRLDQARKVLDEMEAKECVPDLKTWTVLIQGYCTAGQVEKALEFLTEMIEKNIQADADVLDVLVKGLCGKNKADAAYTLFVELENGQVSPWQATYKYLIQELVKVKKLEEALSLLRSMKSRKYPPFPDPFPSYIAKFGTVEDAREFLKALTVNNYPSYTAYLHVFKLFFEEGRYSEAQDLLFKCPIHIRRNQEITRLFESIKVESAS